VIGIRIGSAIEERSGSASLYSHRTKGIRSSVIVQTLVGAPGKVALMRGSIPVVPATGREACRARRSITQRPSSAPSRTIVPRLGSIAVSIDCLDFEEGREASLDATSSIVSNMGGATDGAKESMRLIVGGTRGERLGKLEPMMRDACDSAAVVIIPDVGLKRIVGTSIARDVVGAAAVGKMSVLCIVSSGMSVSLVLIARTRPRGAAAGGCSAASGWRTGESFANDISALGKTDVVRKCSCAIAVSIAEILGSGGGSGSGFVWRGIAADMGCGSNPEWADTLG
jgi:hypothetical protein